MKKEEDTGFICALKVVIAIAVTGWLIGITIMEVK